MNKVHIPINMHNLFKHVFLKDLNLNHFEKERVRI